MKAKRFVYFAVICFLILAVRVGWWLAAQRPIYPKSHRHASVETHAHFHTHGEGLSHGHRHVGLFGTTHHSHAHHHSHVHGDESPVPAADGLTEIGHHHDAHGTTRFWAETLVSQDKIRLTCWTHDKSGLIEMPVESHSLMASIYNGTDLVCKVEFEESGGCFVGTLPEDFFYLPTLVLKIFDLPIADREFDAMIPITR